MTNGLILFKRDTLEFSFNDHAKELKELALSGAALVGRVTNAQENKTAVEAQKELRRVISMFEKERKTAKEPLLEAGRALDRAVAGEQEDLDREEGRLSQLVAEFQLAEQRRVNEERRKQQDELDRIERERQAELKRIADEQAAKEAEARKITDEAARKAREAQLKAEAEAAKLRVDEAAAAKSYVESRPIETTRTDGQVVKTDWNIQVTNPYELAKYHPDCVKIEPLLTPIKAALNEGRTIRGITAEKILKAGVRINSRPIEV